MKDNKELYIELYNKNKILSNRERQVKRADYRAKLDVWPALGLYITLVISFSFFLVDNYMLLEKTKEYKLMIVAATIICVLFLSRCILRKSSIGISAIDDITKNNADYKTRRKL